MIELAEPLQSSISPSAISVGRMAKINLLLVPLENLSLGTSQTWSARILIFCCRAYLDLLSIIWAKVSPMIAMSMFMNMIYDSIVAKKKKNQASGSDPSRPVANFSTIVNSPKESSYWLMKVLRNCDSK